MSLTTEQKRILKSTAPIFKENGRQITSILYKHMFTDHPQLLNIFNRTNQKNGTQPLALANTIYLIIESIDNLDLLYPQILLIAHKHRASTILPEHYPIVGKYLLIAIDEFLGGMGDQEILTAWSAAYNIIASIFINIEKKLYKELGHKRDYGFIPFTIVKKETIASGPIVAFTLVRSDGNKLHRYHPGQYITVCITKEDSDYIRHYTLIQPFDGKTYKIAIKHEVDHKPKGIVSSELIEKHREGDTIAISLPAGTFSLENNGKHHLFIAGGIGITLLSALIRQLHEEGRSDSAVLLHCVHTEGHAAFADDMLSILTKKRYKIVLEGQDQLEELVHEALTPETHVYMCGAVPFMDKVEEYLLTYGHNPEQIHIEAYQPSLSLIKNAVKH